MCMYVHPRSISRFHSDTNTCYSKYLGSQPQTVGSLAPPDLGKKRFGRESPSQDIPCEISHIYEYK